MALVALVTATSIEADTRRSPLLIWYFPASDAPDTPDLFARSGRWSRSRGLVEAIGFSPQQLVESRLPGHALLLPSLMEADAFRRLKSWGIGSVIEVPAIKNWDCVGNFAFDYTLKLMRQIYAAGGTVNFLDMDEPLSAALEVGSSKCNLSMDTAASEVANYARLIGSNEAVAGSGVVPQIFDIEAYPALSVQQLESWIAALGIHGFKPAGFNLDVNVHFVDATPSAKLRLAGDLQDLKNFLSQEAIPFGMIVWSGYDPVTSDQEYYKYALDWARTIHSAIGRPDRVIFESWVKRCAKNGKCVGPKLGCDASDPAYCGFDSVPLNLPEAGPHVFSHTRLIQDAYRILTH